MPTIAIFVDLTPIIAKDIHWVCCHLAYKGALVAAITADENAGRQIVVAKIRVAFEDFVVIGSAPCQRACRLIEDTRLAMRVSVLERDREKSDDARETVLKFHFKLFEFSNLVLY